MSINLDKISPAIFEKVCQVILENSNFENVQWYGETGNDKGRDILAEKISSPLPGVTILEKWLIQCKRYSKKNLSKSELKDIFDSSLEHSIDNVLVITTATLTANTKDWFKSVKNNYPFKIYVWERSDITSHVVTYRSVLIEKIPELTEGKEPIWLYKMAPLDKVTFACNEFEEVDIVVRDVTSEIEGREKLQEFLNHLKNNGFEWWD